jgi:hypothetical protein
LILGAAGATALTIGLGIGATLYANSDSTPPTSTGSISMMDGTAMSMTDGTDMNDGMAMSSMMDGTMSTMMGVDGMAAMHTAMHEAVGDSVPADVLAACDEAHVSMSDVPASSSTDDVPDHAAHHSDGQP